MVSAYDFPLNQSIEYHPQSVLSPKGDDSLDDFSSPLMDMGLDSLAAVEFRNRVQAESRDFLEVLGTSNLDPPNTKRKAEKHGFMRNSHTHTYTYLGHMRGWDQSFVYDLASSFKLPNLRQLKNSQVFQAFWIRGNPDKAQRIMVFLIFGPCFPHRYVWAVCMHIHTYP